MTRLLTALVALSLVAVLGAATFVVLLTGFGIGSDPQSTLEPTPTEVARGSLPAELALSPVSEHDEHGSDIPDQGDSEGARIRASIQSVVSVRTDAGSCGTGFAVARADPGTVVATCKHVTDAAAESLSVILPDGTTHDATLLSAQAAVDVAFILVEDVRDLPILELADADDLKITDRLYVVGFAFGPSLLGDPSITQGILSGRRMIGGVDWLQTDAVVNPGNSGGPVLNSDGNVVGVASWKIAGTEDVPAEGIGFAAPSELVQAELDALELDLIVQ
jgi:serine protease Do